MKKRPYYLVDGYNLIHVWQEINTDVLATAREFLIRSLHEYGAYEKIEIALVFDAARSEDEERVEVYDDFFRVIYSGFNETADNVIERLSYELVQKDRHFGRGSLSSSLTRILSRCQTSQATLAQRISGQCDFACSAQRSRRPTRRGYSCQA